EGRLEIPTERMDRPWLVSDTAETTLLLPPGLPEHSVLELGARATRPGGEVVGVAFRRGTRGKLEQIRGHLGPANDFREKEATALGFQSWDALPFSWQSSLARTRWERLGSLSIEGEGQAPTVPLATTWDATPFDDAAALTTPVGPG